MIKKRVRGDSSILQLQPVEHLFVLEAILYFLQCLDLRSRYYHSHFKISKVDVREGEIKLDGGKAGIQIQDSWALAWIYF